MHWACKKDTIVISSISLDKTTLLDFISMCDVYVTPHLNEAQMIGNACLQFWPGKAVVSTPYWHARGISGWARILVRFTMPPRSAREIAGFFSRTAPGAKPCASGPIQTPVHDPETHCRSGIKAFSRAAAAIRLTVIANRQKGNQHRGARRT
jgi:hypothetical protein